MADRHLPVWQQDKPSALEDIYKSFISHVFEHGMEHSNTCPNAPGQVSGTPEMETVPSAEHSHAEMCQAASVDLKERLEKALRDPGSSAALLTWLGTDDLFTDEPDASEQGLKVDDARLDPNTREWGDGASDMPPSNVRCLELESATIATEDRAELIRIVEAVRGGGPLGEEEYQKLIRNLVGFSLMRVDTLYRQIYYTEILHPLLSKKRVCTLVEQSVMVPLNKGSVGYAARVGGLALADSLQDPRGIVASEDLVLGNTSIMMVGVGVQWLNPISNEEIAEPIPRWHPVKKIDNQDAEGKRSVWNDALLDPPPPASSQQSVCAAAVIFCFFPLADVFPEFGTPDAPVLASSSGFKHRIYTMFEHICRNYEGSILRELQYNRGQFVGRQTDRALMSKGQRPPTLDVIAAHETSGNPTGTLLAVRRTDAPTLRELRASIPGLTAALRERIERHDQMQSLLGVVTTPSHHPSDDRVTPALLAGVRELFAFGVPPPDDPRFTSSEPCVRVFAHANTADFELPNSRPPVAHLSKLLLDLRALYLEPLGEALRDNQALPKDDFREAKIAADIYQVLASTICRLIRAGLEPPRPSEGQAGLREQASDPNAAPQLLRFASMLLEFADSSLVRLKSPDLAQCRAELKRISSWAIRAMDASDKRCMAISAFYWMPHRVSVSNIDWQNSNAAVGAEAAHGQDARTHGLATPDLVDRHKEAQLRHALEPLCVKLIFRSYGSPIPLSTQDVKGGRCSYLLADLMETMGPGGSAVSLTRDAEPASDQALSYGFRLRNAVGTELPIEVEIFGSYRIAELALLSLNTQNWLESQVKHWDQPENDPFVQSLAELLSAKRVPVENWDGSIVVGWDVIFYADQGRYTPHGRQLIERLKAFEDRIQQQAQVKLAHYARGASHGLKNALAVPDLVMGDLVEKVRKGLRQLYSLPARDRAMVSRLVEAAAYVQDEVHYLQEQAELFFWVMDDERARNQLTARASKTNTTPINIAVKRSLLRGLYLAFQTRLISRERQEIMNGLTNDEREQQEIWVSGQLREALLESSIEMAETPQIDDAVRRVVRAFSQGTSLRLECCDVDLKLPIGGVQSILLDAVLVELTQNAAKAAILSAKELRAEGVVPHLTIRASSFGGQTVISIENSAKSSDRQYLVQSNSRARGGRIEEVGSGESGGIQGVWQVRMLCDRLGADLVRLSEEPEVSGANVRFDVALSHASGNRG